MKKEKNKKGMLKWVILILLLVVAVSGAYFWYVKIKKPHDEAVEKFISASENVKTEKHTKFEFCISKNRNSTKK